MSLVPRNTGSGRDRMPSPGTVCRAVFFLFASAVALASGEELDPDSVVVHFESLRAELEEQYRDLHLNPELSFQEKDTSEKLANRLRESGFEVTTGVGGHGVVGLTLNGEGPTLMIRTDMDALPVVEETGLPYASAVTVTEDQGQQVGVMHACGHDMHMTIWSGVAEIMVTLKDEWAGTLMMIAQPAEERGAGARAMLADGLFERFPRPDYALALHLDSGLQSGKVGYVPEYSYANVDTVDILVRGRGGHGAHPHLSLDPVVLAAEIVLALQTIVSRELPPLEPAVVTVGSIHGGTRNNIIPDEVRLQLTVRTYADETRNEVLASIRRISRDLAEAARIPEELLPVVTVKEAYTPALYNDPELVERVVEVFRNTLGRENVVLQKPGMVGEDFGRYGRESPRTPIFMFQLGSVSLERILESQRPGGSPLPSLHSSRFHPDVSRTLRTGVVAMTHAALELLKPRAGQDGTPSP